MFSVWIFGNSTGILLTLINNLLTAKSWNSTLIVITNSQKLLKDYNEYFNASSLEKNSREKNYYVTKYFWPPFEKPVVDTISGYIGK